MVPIGVALIGFGLAGEVFHAPLIAAEPRLALRAVVSSKAEAIARAGLVHSTSVDAVLDDPAISLVVVATPNDTHAALAARALEAGKHVVIDKPLATDAGAALALIDLAQRSGRKFSVFHNRRWDSDFLTVRSLLAERRLGDISYFEAAWDRHRPQVGQHWKEAATPGAGVLADLGPHLIDQALLLFGWPDAIDTTVLRQRAGARSDDLFDIRLAYGSMLVRLGGSMLIAAARPRFQIHGSAGSYVKFGLDGQQAQLKAGLVPGDPDYGSEPPSSYGQLTTIGAGTLPEASSKGAWGTFYRQMAAAIDERAPVPVEPGDALAGIQIMAMAHDGAAQGRVIIPPPPLIPLSSAPIVGR